MIVMHVESGLGNQMLDYADYLAARKANPDAQFYIENIIYSLSEAGKTISMWNGYELGTVFGIEERNFRSLFNDKEWNEFLQLVEKSEFWKHGWTYSKAICDAYRTITGIEMVGVNRHWHDQPTPPPKKTVITTFKKSKIGYMFKRNLYKTFDGKMVNNQDLSSVLYAPLPSTCLSGHWLLLNRKRSGIEMIDEEIRRAFKFPELDEKNTYFLDSIVNKNSVSIHARRGDMLGVCGYCYQYGFFKRSVRYIKERVFDPVFIFFTNEGSVDWCKENLDIFGLSKDKDNIQFVTWNTGVNSYRDMQLMSYCKHNIFTESSFGWWGAYLNTNKNKITCAPDIRINSTNSF